MNWLCPRTTMNSAVLAIAAGAALTLTLAASPRLAAKTQTSSALVDLGSVQEFTKQFNDDRGHVRLVLLLSPT